MKVYELINKVNVDNIGIRLCPNEELAKNRSYKDTTIMYWGLLEDMPAEYASYKIISSNLKNGMLFCWCIEDSIKVKDILEADGSTIDNCQEYLTFFNYISKHDAKTKNHSNAIEITDIKGIENESIIDTEIISDKANIYLFRNNIKSNIFDKNYEGVLEFSEM